jgi:DNA-binding NtrC family response regulator
MPEVINVLCVDDEINILNTIRRQLCDLDVKVHGVLSAEDGLRFLRQTQRIHVVVSDFRMPGMSGIEFLKAVLRERPEASRILLSGYADAAAVQEALAESKLFAFLHKPWKAEELVRIVAEAVSSYGDAPGKR